jgi:hypothetical protein
VKILKFNKLNKNIGNILTSEQTYDIILLSIEEALFASGFRLFEVMITGKKKQRFGWYPKRCMIVYIASI